MLAVSFIGSAAFYLPLLVLAFWCGNPRAAAPAGVALGLSGMLNTLLKLAFQEPRPYWTDPAVHALASESTFGMPSGHAQGSMVAWGFLAVYLTRRGWAPQLPGRLSGALRPGWVWVPTLVVIGLVGVSRVYLGVHSPGQVAAGWAIGGALLFVVVRFGPVVAGRWRDLRLVWQFVLSAVVSLGLLACAVAAVAPLRNWRMPPVWQEAIIRAGGHVDVHPDRLGMERAALAAGLLCGLLVGLSWLAHRGWFAAGGPPLARVSRVLVGVAGLAVINTVLLLPAPHVAVLFLAQALTGLWITVGAPEAFVRLGLARRPTPGLTRPGEPALTRDS
ncbi:PAP2 superfamily protein [Thermomonospora echinospora]|uniref:PAP2 superfamily protein n=2 Tax=Thermomonospora echinospora TaxID=1992 RepID=A0A1H5SG18_9ACTN|nr:PAP2 superfamily protein [Thermomonospora echinospora]